MGATCCPDSAIDTCRHEAFLASMQADVQNFELWRWLFFFGFLAPIWWVGDFVVRLLVFLVESAFLNTKNVMYFLVAIRVSHVLAVLFFPVRILQHKMG